MSLPRSSSQMLKHQMQLLVLKPRKKVVVLQPSYQDSTSAIASLDFERDLSKWVDHDKYELVQITLTKSQIIQKIRENSADIYVNLCDGAWDEDSPGIDVVLALERFSKCFTGANSRCYDPTRDAMKKTCLYWGIPTPRYKFAFTDEDIREAGTILKFPLFVKHFHGYNSVGITKASRVENVNDLQREATRVMQSFGGALIEEFVDGREFSVLVMSNPTNDQEPTTFKSVECVFEEDVNFKTFDFKWNGAKNPWKLVADADLDKRLRQMSLEIFVALGIEGYGRTDIRMDKEGKLYFLEINPNCSVFYPDDNGGTADEILNLDGFGKTNFLHKMIEFAEHRRDKAIQKYTVEFNPITGNSLRAARDISIGETIVYFEETPHRLVSKEHVKEKWNDRFKTFFKDYCWPITEDLYVMWDEEPESWKPINHSCDPNAWVSGLNLIARNAIHSNEQITMDYATMYTSDDGPAFECKCGSPKCRGGYKSDDYAQDWFKERYGEHVTAHVKQMQRFHEKLKQINASTNKTTNNENTTVNKTDNTTSHSSNNTSNNTSSNTATANTLQKVDSDIRLTSAEKRELLT